MRRILSFISSDPPRLEQVGGKAYSLMNMIGQGMPVPAGFVLTVDFFTPWMDQLQITPEWSAVQRAGEDDLGGAARALQDLCLGLSLNDTQKSELSQALQDLRATNPVGLYAVRSSSPLEDRDQASFAGGYETTLGVTEAAMEAAILRSFASCFNERVFLYKRRHGMAGGQPRIAVVVQIQVNADSAGVAFSLNPLNNCYDEAVINANFGLGESVVAGKVDPDRFVVDKVTRRILETSAGRKQGVTRLNLQGGAALAALAAVEDGDASGRTSITPEQALRVVDMLVQVENRYQSPVDIEWAFAADELFLLQARPITTYLPLPAEMVTAPGEPRRLYANSTLIEQGVEKPLSVLGTDFLGRVLNKVGGPVAEGAIGPDGVTFTAGGFYYMNISYAHRIGMKNAALAPGSFGDPRVTAILDSIDMKQYSDGELPARLKALRGKLVFKMLPMALSALRAYLRPAATLERYQAALPDAARRLKVFSGSGLSLEASATALTGLLQFFYGDFGIPMILAAQLAQERIKNLFKQEGSRVKDRLVNLGIALPGNKTAEMGAALVNLASSADIHRYETADDFLADLEGNRLSPSFRKGWEDFMAEYGMRCPVEIDAATPRPSEKPALLFEQLKRLALGSDSQAFFEEARARRDSAYQALHEIASQKGKSKANALEKAYKTWVTLGGYRETPKHYVVQVVALFRRQALEIAQRFVAEGRMDTPEQIFNLTIADIDRANSDPTIDLRAMARERTALTDRIRKSHFVVRIIDSRGKIYFPPRTAAVDGELNGVPISPGLVRGRVKVFHHPAEKTLHPGEILVARAVDPGWTPLFIHAKAIILEIGGALQHGAVVAREYGIPCVSGLDGASSLLKDGQMVEVDGSNGVVRILDPL